MYLDDVVNLHRRITYMVMIMHACMSFAHVTAEEEKTSTLKFDRPLLHKSELCNLEYARRLMFQEKHAALQTQQIDGIWERCLTQEDSWSFQII